MSESAKKVFAALIAGGAASRPSLGTLTDLSKQTVSLAVQELETAGLAEKITSQQGPMGRAAVIYDVGRRSGWLLGIDLGSTHVRVAASTLAGVLIAEREHMIAGAPNQANAILGDAAGTIVRAFIEELEPDHGPLRSVCVALSRSVPELRDWQGADLPGGDLPQIIAQIGVPRAIPVYAENNVNCAALGEARHGGARGEHDLAYLQVGVGLGAGIIIGGHLLRGAAGQGGELRKLPVSGLFTPGPAPRNAQHELRAAGLIERYNEARGTEGGADADSSEEVFRRAEAGLSAAQQAVLEEAAGVGHLAAALVAIASPSLIILGGGIGGSARLLPLVRRFLEDQGIDVRVTSGELGSSATVAGAAALAAELHLEHMLGASATAALSGYESRWSIG
ncbi:ROK family protein [Plantibacter sp. MPB07]|uniref:ROK family protein n=1 Tax=Plantibacter sp. MPB07 TaxID=3388853 RepID=UPI003987A96A